MVEVMVVPAATEADKIVQVAAVVLVAILVMVAMEAPALLMEQLVQVAVEAVAVAMICISIQADLQRPAAVV
jgi:hypothetical protein